MVLQSGLSKRATSIGTSTLAIASACAALLLTTGCESDSQRTLASAQSCLDSANDEASANVCIEKVAGDTSAAANAIRCSAHFIAQGFTGTRVADAYQRMTSGSSSSGTDPVINIMAFLVFTNTSTINSAAAAVTDCAAASSPSMEQLALVAQLATNATSLTASLTNLNLTNFNPDDPNLINNVKSVIAQATNLNSTDKAEIGQIALNMNTAFCGTGSSMTNQDVCTYMASAISSSNGTPAGVADAFFALLQTKN